MKFAQVNVIVGHRGTGKTVYAKRCIESYMSASIEGNERKVLIIDTYDNPDYAQFEIIQPEKLLVWKKGVKRIIVNAFEVDNVLKLLIDNEINNFFLILEDAQKQFDETVSDVQKIWLADAKNKNRETLLIFHFFENVPRRLFKMINGVVIKKSSDSPGDVKKRSQNALLLQAFKDVNDHKNPYYSKYVRLTD
jgi:hypothetical protein